MKLDDLVKSIGIRPDENNKALNTYIQNKGRLNSLLSTLNNIPESLQTAEITEKELYDYIYKGLDGLEYTVSDINKVANSPIYFGTGYDTGNKRVFGLALSALINKVVKKGDKVQLNMSRSVDHLFYLADGIEAHVNIAGDYLGDSAKNSKIYAEKAEYAAGVSMNKCELHVNEAGNYLGEFADNSKIYAEKAEYAAGHYMDNCELYIKNLIGDLANSCFRRNNEIYLGKESYKLHPIKYKLKRVDIWETP
jgi:hypothetical protein